MTIWLLIFLNVHLNAIEFADQRHCEDARAVIGRLTLNTSVCVDSGDKEMTTHHADDDTLAYIKKLEAERDAAFAMSKCECGRDETCANLVNLWKEIAHIKQNYTLCEKKPHSHKDIHINGKWKTVPLYAEAK